MEIKEIKNGSRFEKYYTKCPACNKVIIGSTKDQVIYNLATHKDSKSCKKKAFEDRVTKTLPPRTPGYVSSKKRNTKVEDKKNGN